MTEQEVKNEIERLSTQLHQYNQKYYQENISEISDYEFDMMLEKLQKLEQEFPQFKHSDSPSQRVGGTITKEFETVAHQFPMLSLGNTYSEMELIEFDKRIQKRLENESYTYICEMKFDGVALGVRFKHQKLDRAITRGDGKMGDDVTANVKTIRTIPLRLEANSTVDAFEVRGEVIITKENFSRLNQEIEKENEQLLAEGKKTRPLLANPRNTASGALKMQDSNLVSQRKLTCFFYDIYGNPLPFETHEIALRQLTEWGFNVSETWKKCNNIGEVIQYIKKWETKRHELPVETDGIVIKINHFKQRQVLGNTSKNPRWAIAYKYKAETAKTRLEAITYQVGRTGAITPVAELKSIQLAGTTVRRASLHNANEIERLDIRLGDTVSVEKGGEIIPKVTAVDVSKRPKNSMKFIFISRCPECHTTLIRNEGEAVHYCPNETSCPPQVKGKIKHFVSRKALDIDGIGEKTIEQLYENGLIQSIGDLYDLESTALLKLQGFKAKSVKNILDGLENSKNQPFKKVLFALGIRYVGATVAEKLTTYFKNIQALAKAEIEELIEVPEIGQRIAESVYSYFRTPTNQDLIIKLERIGLQFKEQETHAPDEQKKGKLAELHFLVTGKLTRYTRNEIEQLIKHQGGIVLSGVSKKLNFLIAGDKAGSKLKKAIALNVTVLSEEEFMEMIQ